MSRVSVQVVLRDSRSISPDCRAVSRACALSGTYLTFLSSPNTAAATARQTSTSIPRQTPFSSGAPKPYRSGVHAADQLTPRLHSIQRWTSNGSSWRRRHGHPYKKQRGEHPPLQHLALSFDLPLLFSTRMAWFPNLRP